MARPHAEAIAFKIDTAASDLVTKDFLREQLDAQSARLLVKVGVMTSGIVAVATGILGVLISVK